MKYLKTYEELEDNCGEYKVGDYVVIDTDKVVTSTDDFFSAFDDEKMEKYIYAKITEIINNDEYPLKIYTALGATTSTNKDEIERYMTSDEIERYEAEENAKKYNL